MKTNVKGYTDEQIIKKITSLDSFQYIPNEYFFVFIRSNENAPNVFDDKCYQFKGRQFIQVTSCTTNAGSKGLKNYQKYNPLGTFVAKSNEWYYGLWKYGLHRGRMPALKQIRKIKGYRDNNRNLKAESIGKIVSGYFGINFHTVDYRLRPNFILRFIGGWSVGCFVLNIVRVYLQMLDRVKNQTDVTCVLIDEFDI